MEYGVTRCAGEGLREPIAEGWGVGRGLFTKEKLPINLILMVPTIKFDTSSYFLAFKDIVSTLDFRLKFSPKYIMPETLALEYVDPEPWWQKLIILFVPIKSVLLNGAYRVSEKNITQFLSKKYWLCLDQFQFKNGVNHEE